MEMCCKLCYFVVVKPIMKEEKQPSIDDLLFMDEDEELPHMPIGQGQVTGQVPQQIPADLLDDDSFIDLKALRGSGTASSSLQGETYQVTNKSSGKLSTPVTLHARSRSNPIDTVTVPSQSPVIHARSRSRDFDKSQAPKSKTDPFSFVDDAMAHSRAVGISASDGNSSMETQSYSLRTTINSKEKASDAAAAATAAAKKLTTRSQTEAARGQREFSDSNLGQNHESKGALNPLYEHNRNKGKDFGSKNCSQEAGKQTDITIEDDSSQDTYEVSSSPVY